MTTCVVEDIAPFPSPNAEEGGGRRRFNLSCYVLERWRPHPPTYLRAKACKNFRMPSRTPSREKGPLLPYEVFWRLGPGTQFVSSPTSKRVVLCSGVDEG